MGTTIHRTEDPTLETAELGAVHRIRAPRTGKPWTPRKVSDDCGVSSTGPLNVPDGRDDSHEYAMGDHRIQNRLARPAMDAHLARTILEVALAPVDDEETTADSCAPLHHFVRPH